MFTKRKEDGQPEYEKIEPVAETRPDVRKRKVSVIGPTLKFSGELSANEDLIIEGEIEGTIAHQDKNLTVGHEGRVKADIKAKTVEIYGSVEGDIRGEDLVKLAKTSRVKGNVYCARIVMEDGATISGNMDRSESDSSKPPKLAIAESAEQTNSAG